MTGPGATPGALDAVEALFAETPADAPGCAVGVVANGEVVFAKGYGLANLEHATPITPASRFYLASVSKQVAALSVLLAAEAGAFDLDASIRAPIPELPAYLDQVTLRHLLTHTGGVRDYFTLGFLAGWGAAHPYSEADVLQIVGRQRALNFTPGDDFLYSNSGYVLLSIAVARATGKPLDAFAREAIFTPLGMGASRFQHDHTAIVPAKASGYEQRGGDWHVADTYLDVVGDGGMYASLDDMLAWTRNLLEPRLGAAAIPQMQAQAALTGGAPTGYGMGLQLGAHRGLAVLEHGGGNAGYRTHLLAYPSENFGVVVLCNDAAAFPMVSSRRVAAAFLGDRMTPAPVAPAMLEPGAAAALAGCYRAPTGDIVAFVEHEGQLFMRGVPGALWPLSERVFAFAGDADLTRFEFEAGAVTMAAGAASRRYERCETTSLADPTPFLGAFACPEAAGAVCQVAHGDNGLTVSFAGSPPVTLQAIGPDRLWSPDFGATLTFRQPFDGPASCFQLDAGRVRGLAYVRAN